jgi:hypothetical protein
MDVQATGEAISPQRDHLGGFKPPSFFIFLWVVFALFDPDPDPAEQSQCGSIRGLDPQHWLYLLENQGFFHYAISPV